MHNGDWFLRVDADEFHHIAPPEFVKNCMGKHETAAYHQYYDFHLLQSEVNAWNAGEETLKDRRRPIEDRRRHYTVSEYSEPRLCRYRETMQWPVTVSFPFNAGYVARERLPIRHECEWKKFITPDDLPGLKLWKSGTELPLVRATNHLKPSHIRVVQRFMHAFCLPMLDRLRPKFPPDSGPQSIPKEIVELLQEKLNTVPGD